MKQKNKAVTLHEVRLLFENKFPELLAGAVDSPDEASFRQKIDAYLSDASWNAEGVRVVRRLLEELHMLVQVERYIQVEHLLKITAEQYQIGLIILVSLII